jgi:circadian clock protein KaiC
MLRRDAERYETRLVVIDSLSGYLTSMPQEKQLLLQLHEFLSYLNQRGIFTLLVSPESGLMGAIKSTLNVSYIADTILLLRFFEAAGRVRKALSVIKNRGGGHEDTIRELRIDRSGPRIGEVLADFEGVLTGMPSYIGKLGPLLEQRSESIV